MIHELIKKRRSPVIFSDRPVEDEKLELIFEAARWAPSSNNQQPWRFIVTKKEDSNAFNRLFECLTPANQLWVKNVPVLALSIAETISGYNNKVNKYAFHDVGLAVGNLLLQATALGLYVHQMGGYDKEKARNNLGIPGGYDPVAAIAIGYIASSYEGFPEELVKKEKSPRKRRPLNESVYYGKWGNSLF
jgi:nitroreductase